MARLRIAGAPFRLVDGFIDGELASSRRAEAAQDLVERVGTVVRVHEHRHRDGARVHHRVVRPIGCRSAVRWRLNASPLELDVWLADMVCPSCSSYMP